MKRILLFVCLSAFTATAMAQRIENKDHVLLATVDYDNTSFVNTSGATICKFFQDGRITDGHSNTLGYIVDEYELQDADHNVVAYYKRNGEIEDSDHNVIGNVAFGSTATFTHSTHGVLGYAQKAEPVWAAAYFFVISR